MSTATLSHVCPLTTIGVFNIPPVALNPRALQSSLSPRNKDSVICTKALFLFPSSRRPLKLISRLCHFAQRAGLVVSSLLALRVVPCSAVSAPIASPSSVTPPSGVTVMDAASLFPPTPPTTTAPASLVLTANKLTTLPPLSANLGV